MHLHDQRSVTHAQDQSNTAVYLHDQRTLQMNMGVPADQVIARESELMSQAHAAVSAARTETQVIMSHAESEVRALQEQVQVVQGEAQSRVLEAHAHVQSVESQASRLVDEMQRTHKEEVEKLQDIAQRAYAEAQQQLSVSEDRNRQLLEMIDRQAKLLETQKKDQVALASQVAMLQNELTLLQHSAVPQTPQSYIHNGAVDAQELLKVMGSLKEEVKRLQNIASGSPHGSLPMDHPTTKGNRLVLGTHLLTLLLGHQRPRVLVRVRHFRKCFRCPHHQLSRLIQDRRRTHHHHHLPQANVEEEEGRREVQVLARREVEILVRRSHLGLGVSGTVAIHPLASDRHMSVMNLSFTKLRT